MLTTKRFLQLLHDTPAPGESARLKAVRRRLTDASLRLAETQRLMTDMNDPSTAFSGIQKDHDMLSPDRKRILLREIIDEGKRRHAAESADMACMIRPFGFRLAAGILTVFVASTATLAAAAEVSLPGDPLYPIKTGIIETMIGSMQFTPKSRTEWAGQKVQRRLKESVLLSSDPDADEQTHQFATAAIEQEIDNANDLAEAVALQGEAETALDLQADIEATLDAYEILHQHTDTDSEPIRDIIRRKKRDIARERRETEQLFIESVREDLKQEAEERAELLKTSLVDIGQSLEQNDMDVLQEDISALAIAAEKSLDDAENLMGKEKMEEALLRLESALRLTEEADHLINNIDLVENLVNEGDTILPERSSSDAKTDY